jgi:hypothetical protein
MNVMFSNAWNSCVLWRIEVAVLVHRHRTRNGEGALLTTPGSTSVLTA